MLVVFENPPSANPWLNPEFLSQYEDKGVKIHIEAGINVELQRLFSIPPE